MNAYFQGARSVYNATGGSYHDVQELLSAEYAWNVRSDGFYRNPRTEAETDEIARWVYTPGEPPEIFGPGKLFDRICTRLYGEAAGKPMSQLYRLAKWLPEDQPKDTLDDSGTKPAYYRGRTAFYLHRTWNYIHAVPYYWFYLLMDSGTWHDGLGRYNDAKLAPEEIHRRLARRWTLGAELNEQGAGLVEAALRQNPRPDALEDLRFLRSLFRVYEPMLAAMRDYHAVRAHPSAAGNPELLASALRNARAADELAAQLFPAPVDTTDDEVRSLRKYPAELASAIVEWQQRPEGTP